MFVSFCFMYDFYLFVLYDLINEKCLIEKIVTCLLKNITSYNGQISSIKIHKAYIYADRHSTGSLKY